MHPSDELVVCGQSVRMHDVVRRQEIHEIAACGLRGTLQIGSKSDIVTLLNNTQSRIAITLDHRKQRIRRCIVGDNDLEVGERLKDALNRPPDVRSVIEARDTYGKPWR